MGLFDIHIKELHIHTDNDKLDQILNELQTLKTITMANFAEIKTEFETLKTAIAEERAQATAKLAELQASIDALTQNLAEGGTVEERDALLADITTQVAEVKAIIPDPATEPPVEPEA